ncbi:MAG: hypothetical protein WC499_03970 [Patescibacteria group bacterium]
MRYLINKNKIKKIIKTIENITKNYHIHILANPTINYEKNEIIFKISKKSSHYLYAIWASLVYKFCEKRIANNAFEMPISYKNNYSVIWIKRIKILFLYGKLKNIKIPDIPRIKHPKIIALGGASGSGKTSIFKKLKEKYPKKISNYPAYTTRKPRQEEQNKIDYFFCSKNDLDLARKNPNYTNFVEARNNWYWIKPANMLRGVWQNHERIHFFFISQVNDYKARKKLFPQMKWVWIYTDPKNIILRLKKRGDNDIKSSLSYNHKIIKRLPESLIDLKIKNEQTKLDAAVNLIDKFCGLQNKK